MNLEQMTMNLTDYILLKGGIFDEIYIIGGVYFGDKDKLDKALALQYGDRILHSKIALLDKIDVANILILNYGDKWKAMLDVSQSDTSSIDPLATNTKRITETINTNEKAINTSENLNKVGAMNESELVVNDGSNNTQNENKDGITTRVYTEELLSYENAFNKLSIIKKNSIIDTVLKDIAEMLTLSIY